MLSAVRFWNDPEGKAPASREMDGGCLQRLFFGQVEFRRVMPVLSVDEPLVLLDDSSANHGRVLLYRHPRSVLLARSIEEVDEVLRRARQASRAGRYVAGYVAYEAGAAFEPKLPRRVADTLAWFGIFDRQETLEGSSVETLLPELSQATVGALRPTISRDEYVETIRHILGLIGSGDLYQVNYTFRAKVDFSGDPLALYARLRRHQRTPYSAVVATSEETILSLSPELFFSLEGDRIACRPMKGTAARCAQAHDDWAARRDLSSDAKQRAENLMIVDLMRNDVSKISVPGSVSVPDLFIVEDYPTVFQMVSSVVAQARSGLRGLDALEQLFPCGSITGAPKMRAMEAIHALEHDRRGVYTGSIGHIEPSGDACFNVAIRTLHHRRGQAHMTIGLGSGVVADSVPEAEWQECLMKADFLWTRLQVPHGCGG